MIAPEKPVAAPGWRPLFGIYNPELNRWAIGRERKLSRTIEIRASDA